MTGEDVHYGILKAVRMAHYGGVQPLFVYVTPEESRALATYIKPSTKQGTGLAVVVDELSINVFASSDCNTGEVTVRFMWPNVKGGGLN